MNNREIDVLIAKQVMGLEVVPFPCCSPAFVDFGIGKDGFDGPLPKYSNDIAAAWEVLEKLGGVGTSSGYCIDISYDGGWIVNIGNQVESNEETAPMAICLAALKAKGVEVPE